jgi:antagonist of KipI
MSLQIIKAGIFDTVQDLGRYRYQHLGINPGGAMDRFSAQLANALLGRNLHQPVIELHYPASTILFQQPTIICISGADFTPAVNDSSVPLHQPLFVPAHSLLQWKGQRQGARCYLSFLADLAIEPWLNSYSTNTKAAAGGYKGRPLLKDDVISFYQTLLPYGFSNTVTSLPWKYQHKVEASDTIEFLMGNEWSWLTENTQQEFLQERFCIAPASDRMGYRLEGKPLKTATQEQLISSAVSFGTIQLFPSGQLVVLMADHQTTGGYPRIGHVISAHLPRLAQKRAGAEITFVPTSLKVAQEKWLARQQYLMQLQKTCNLKMQNWVNAH